jgi:hypothetical protein
MNDPEPKPETERAAAYRRMREHDTEENRRAYFEIVFEEFETEKKK